MKSKEGGIVKLLNFIDPNKDNVNEKSINFFKILLNYYVENNINVNIDFSNNLVKNSVKYNYIKNIDLNSYVVDEIFAINLFNMVNFIIDMFKDLNDKLKLHKEFIDEYYGDLLYIMCMGNFNKILRFKFKKGLEMSDSTFNILEKMYNVIETKYAAKKNSSNVKDVWSPNIDKSNSIVLYKNSGILDMINIFYNLHKF